MTDPFTDSAQGSFPIPPRWAEAESVASRSGVAADRLPPNVPATQPQRPVSVTELTRKIKRLLETQITDILVEGEISGYKAASSGHLYFDLKDSGALIHCVMWASDAARLRFCPDNGAKVEIKGRLTVYDQRGQYQLTASAMRPAGLGKLYQQFMEMKERLAAEGLFEPARKKPLPSHPNCIGIVTSPTGAAIQDMINILSRRAPHIHVIIWPARVQGEGAAKDVAKGIKGPNSLDRQVDVLIVGRGGGSLEDLWAFNEEIVARAISDSRIPVISAVGHETDTTIADFVADMRAPTPSAAAELVARDSAEILQHLSMLQNRAFRAIREQIAFLQQSRHLGMRLEAAVLPRLSGFRAQLREAERSYGMQLAVQRVNQGKQHYDNLMDQMRRAITQRMRDRQLAAGQFDNQLRHLNPKAILKRGYSITYDADSGHIIQRAKEVRPGCALNIILGEGQIVAHAAAGLNSPTAPAAAPKRRKTKKPNPTLEWFGLADDTNSE